MQRQKSSRASFGYGQLLVDGGFQSFLWTQFLGAFNDNVYKMIVSLLAVEIAANQQFGARYLSLAGAVFVLPFLLFAGYSGQIADRFSKTRVLQVTKSLEILTMTLGLGALMAHRIDLLLAVLFLLAMQANFFSPAKYGILPEMMGEAQLTRANGLVELSTFAAIVLGSSFGTFLFLQWRDQPWKTGTTLLAIAIVGTLFSLRITYVPSAGSREPFHWNPFAEIWTGARHLRQHRPLLLSVIGISCFWFIGALLRMAVLLLGPETLHASQSSVGLLVTALAVGIGLGSIAAGVFSRDHIELGLVPVGLFGLGVSSVFISLTTSYRWDIFWLLLVGFAGGLFIVPLNAFLQDKTAPQEKGRILATNNFANMLGVIVASGVLSLLHDTLHWKAATILGILGAITTAATVYAVWLVPKECIRIGVKLLLQMLFRVRVVGAGNIPAEGPALLVSNHVSFADAFLIGCCTPRFIRFMMWQPYFEIKVLKPILELLHTIPIATSSPKQALRSLRAARTVLEVGELVCIFPEGEITRTGHVQPFERGVEHILSRSNKAPVVPIYLYGLWGHPASRKVENPRRGWLSLWRRPVTVWIGEAIHGGVSAAEIRAQVLELGTLAAAEASSPDGTLIHRMVSACRQNWNRQALSDSSGQQLTFGKTLTAAMLLRNWLCAQCPGEQNVGLLLPASVGGALANFGVTLAGRTAVNLNFTSGEATIDAAIERCGIRTLLTSRAFVQKAALRVRPEMIYLEDLLPAFGSFEKFRALLAARFVPARLIAGSIRPDDPAAIVFSSGCTGSPKAVLLSHFDLLSNMDSTGSLFDLGRAHCMLGVLPFFHSFGFTYTLWFPLLNQFRAVYHPNPTDAKTVGGLAAKHRATFLLTTPTFCRQYLHKVRPEQFSSLRYVVAGAEKLKPALAEEFQNTFGLMPLEGYGCAEMGPVIAVNALDVKPQKASRPGTVGRPIPGVSVRVVHPETSAPVPAGTPGLLLVNGPGRMRGYYRDHEATDQSLKEGYYVTGDLGCLDDEGFLNITDRLARFSKIGGEIVPHTKIEEAVSDAVAHAPCFVTGVPDERRGERLAVLYTSAEHTPGQLIENLTAAGLPALWIPKRGDFYLVPAIPVLGSGKIDLGAARQMVLARLMDSESPAAVGSKL